MQTPVKSNGGQQKFMTNQLRNRRTGLLAAALSLAIICLAGFASPAHANSITVTETATATGSLDGQSFTNAMLTLTMTGNTASVFNVGGYASVLIDPATVSISGVGSEPFTDTIETVVNQNNEDAGFGDAVSNLAILFTANSVFATDTLTNLTGPVSGTALINAGDTFNVLGGTLVLTGASNATFSVVLGGTSTPTPTPEPSSLLLLASGVIGLALMSPWRKWSGHRAAAGV